MYEGQRSSFRNQLLFFASCGFQGQNSRLEVWFGVWLSAPLPGEPALDLGLTLAVCEGQRLEAWAQSRRSFAGVMMSVQKRVGPLLPSQLHKCLDLGRLVLSHSVSLGWLPFPTLFTLEWSLCGGPWLWGLPRAFGSSVRAGGEPEVSLFGN